MNPEIFINSNTSFLSQTDFNLFSIYLSESIF